MRAKTKGRRNAAGKKPERSLMQNKTSRTASPAPSSGRTEKRTTNGDFPIVGIGASAGGLEAMEQFLHHVPKESGMAFIIVQHLDPLHKGILHELLQRTTTMEVLQIRDRMKVKPNCVYVIPPTKDMTIREGTLRLTPLSTGSGLQRPIDDFKLRNTLFL